MKRAAIALLTLLVILSVSLPSPCAGDPPGTKEQQITGIIKESGFTQAKIAIPATKFDSALSAESG